MKTVFTMLGEGRYNRTAFGFDVYDIRQNAGCEFRPNSEYTIKVEWREGDLEMTALAGEDVGSDLDGEEDETGKEDEVRSGDVEW